MNTWIALHICKAKKKTKWHLRLKSQICDETTLGNLQEKKVLEKQKLVKLIEKKFTNVEEKIGKLVKKTFK